MIKIESKGHADDTYVTHNGKPIDGIESIELRVRKICKSKKCSNCSRNPNLKDNLKLPKIVGCITVYEKLNEFSLCNNCAIIFGGSICLNSLLEEETEAFTNKEKYYDRLKELGEEE